MNVKTDTEEMRAVVDEFSAIAKELHSIKNDLKNTIGQIATSWNGPAGTEYVHQLKQQLNEIDALIDYVNAAQQFSKQRSEDFIFADKKNASNIQNIGASMDAISKSIQETINSAFSIISRR